MSTIRRLRRRLLESAAALLYGTGVLPLLARWRFRDRAIVLMYHRVVGPEQLGRIRSHPGIVVSAPTFERHLRMLRRHFRMVTIDEFEERMQNGQVFLPRTCLVTFDDGWADNHERAFPLLRRHGVPAVIFLASAFVGTDGRFWQEMLADALLRALDQPGRPEHGALLQRAGIVAPYASNAADRQRQVHERIDAVKSLPADARAELVRDAQLLVQRGGTSGHDDRFLTWSQVREMMAAGIGFGSHTRHHELLTAIPARRVAEEAAGARADIERETGTVVSTFAYPNGNHDAAVRGVVRDCGFALAFTTEPSRVRAGGDRLRVGRMNVHEGAAATGPMLMARMLGAQ